MRKSAVELMAALITKSQMMPLLLEACPCFTPYWQAFIGEWQGKDDLPLYTVFGELVSHLSAQLEVGQTSAFPAFFQVVEHLILEGDQNVSEAAVVGVLEDLQNINLHKVTTPEQFVPYLGHESKYWWNKLNRFWEDGEMLVDDRRKDH